MATADQRLDHSGRDQRSDPAAGRRRGQGNLAEVIMIRPERSRRTGLIGSLITKARVFASPRTQATPERSTPRRPSSPALRPVTPPQVPHDAA